MLDKREIELYVRVLGARIFQDLGYAEQLEEAEKLTGVRFGMEPDEELLALRAKQLTDAAGRKWEEGYTMTSKPAAGKRLFLPGRGKPAADSRTHPDTLQLQITIRALEKRLEIGAMEQRQLNRGSIR